MSPYDVIDVLNSLDRFERWLVEHWRLPPSSARVWRVRAMEVWRMAESRPGEVAWSDLDYGQQQSFWALQEFRKHLQAGGRR